LAKGFDLRAVTGLRRKEDYLPIAERLCAVGFRCVIPDLPGHGDHPADIATYGVREAGLPVRLLREASHKFVFNPHPAGLMGMSMGGSIAVHAADQPGAPWKALVVVASFDSFPAVIQGQAVRHSVVTFGPLWADATNAVYHWKSGIWREDIQPTRHAASIRVPIRNAWGNRKNAFRPETIGRVRGQLADCDAVFSAEEL
jgi:pimeloyl-ACP methyl ester carboxylesterase